MIIQTQESIPPILSNNNLELDIPLLKPTIPHILANLNLDMDTLLLEQIIPPILPLSLLILREIIVLLCLLILQGTMVLIHMDSNPFPITMQPTQGSP